MDAGAPVPQRKLHYGWIVVGVTFVTLLIGAGVRSTPGILLVPLENEFQWSRATISLAVAISLFLYGFIGPFAAAAMERFGLRRTMLASLSLLAVGVALTTLMRESWQLILLWGLVVGGGTGFIANVLGAIVASTVRLSLHARTDEIQIQRLVGAGGTFVRLPFCLEGALQGALAALLALALLRALFALGLPVLGDALGWLLGGQPARFFGPTEAAALIGLGTALGLGGALASLVSLDQRG